MLRVRCHPKLALLDGNNAVDAHDPSHAIHGTAHLFCVMQLIPYSRTAIIAIVLQKNPSYLNEQLFVIDSILAFRPLLERVIPAPRHFHCPAHLLERKDQSVIVYELKPFSVGFENMPTAFFRMSRSISTSRSFRRSAASSLKFPLPGKALSP